MWVFFQNGWLLCKHLQLTNKFKGLWKYRRKKGFDLGSYWTNYFDPGYFIIKNDVVFVIICNIDFWVNATNIFKTVYKYCFKLQLFQKSIPGEYNIITNGVFKKNM